MPKFRVVDGYLFMDAVTLRETSVKGLWCFTKKIWRKDDDLVSLQKETNNGQFERAECYMVRRAAKQQQKQQQQAIRLNIKKPIVNSIAACLLLSSLK